MPMSSKILILGTMWDYLFRVQRETSHQSDFSLLDIHCFDLIDDHFYNCIWKLKSSNTKKIITLYVVLLLSENENFHFKKLLWKHLLFKSFATSLLSRRLQVWGPFILTSLLRICLCNFWLSQKANTISIFVLDNFRVPIIDMLGSIVYSQILKCQLYNKL